MSPLRLDLSASEAKVERAIEHFEVLERELPAEFEEDGPYAVRFSEVDPQTGWCDVSLALEPDKPRFGIIIGDVIHSLRSALDYVVTALVDASGVDLLTAHQFPIYISDGKYARSVGDARTANPSGCLRNVVHGLGLIEQLQPYHIKPDPRDDPLWHIHRFNNADKHREIVDFFPIPMGAIDIKFRGTRVENEVVTDFPPDWTPKDETVIYRMRFDPPVAYNLRVEGPMRIAVAFSVPPFDGEPIHTVHIKVLRHACDHVGMILELFKLL